MSAEEGRCRAGALNGPAIEGWAVVVDARAVLQTCAIFGDARGHSRRHERQLCQGSCGEPLALGQYGQLGTRGSQGQSAKMGASLTGR